MINSMLNHVAILKPQLPQLNVKLVYHGILPKVVSGLSALFTTLNWGGGGGDKVCFVNVSCNGLKGFVRDCLKHTEFNCA